MFHSALNHSLTLPFLVTTFSLQRCPCNLRKKTRFSRQTRVRSPGWASWLWVMGLSQTSPMPTLVWEVICFFILQQNVAQLFIQQQKDLFSPAICCNPSTWGPDDLGDLWGRGSWGSWAAGLNQTEFDQRRPQWFSNKHHGWIQCFSWRWEG